MTIFEMLQQSAVLTVLGMIIVFAFLWIMILVINLVGKILQCISPEKYAVKSKNNISADTKILTPEIAAAITTAVIKYKNGEKG